MRTRLQRLVTWGVLTLVCGCGGQVVVDPGSGSSDDISGGVCDAYCTLVHTATEACRVYEWCMESCVGAFTRANEHDCSDEMLALYECYNARFRKSGACNGGCPEEANAYHICLESDEDNHE